MTAEMKTPNCRVPLWEAVTFAFFFFFFSSRRRHTRLQGDWSSDVCSSDLAEQGEFGLVVHPDGRGEEVTFPTDSTTANRDVSTLTGDLSPDGVFSGRYVHVATGDQQYSLRRTFATALGPDERERLTRTVANLVFPGASGDSLEMFDGRDLNAQPRVAFVVRGAQVTSKSGTSDILTVPLHNYGAVKALATELGGLGPRKFPIEVAAVSGPHLAVAELQLTLPQGWRGALPPHPTGTSAFGNHTAGNAPDSPVPRRPRPRA